jgi:hypothetical protein
MNMQEPNDGKSNTHACSPGKKQVESNQKQEHSDTDEKIFANEDNLVNEDNKHSNTKSFDPISNQQELSAPKHENVNTHSNLNGTNSTPNQNNSETIKINAQNIIQDDVEPTPSVSDLTPFKCHECEKVTATNYLLTRCLNYE